jgi:hypothetical protein
VDVREDREFREEWIGGIVPQGRLCLRRPPSTTKRHYTNKQRVLDHCRTPLSIFGITSLIVSQLG